MLRHLLLSRSYRLYIRRGRWEGGRGGEGWRAVFRIFPTRAGGRRMRLRGERVYISSLRFLVFDD